MKRNKKPVITNLLIEKIIKDRSLSGVVARFSHSLVGLDTLAALKKIGAEMSTLEKLDGHYKRRNEYVPLFQEVMSKGEYDYYVGERVSYHFSPHTIRIGNILEISEGYATFSDCIVPLANVFRKNTEPVQLSFFDK